MILLKREKVIPLMPPSSTVSFSKRKSRSTHTTIEKLVKPVSKLMTNIMFGEKVKWAFGKNPYQRHTIWKSNYCHVCMLADTLFFSWRKVQMCRGHTSTSYSCASVYHWEIHRLLETFLCCFAFGVGYS